MNCIFLRLQFAFLLGLALMIGPFQLAQAQAPQGKPLTIRGKIAAVE